MNANQTQQYYDYLKTLPMDNLDPTDRVKMMHIVRLCMNRGVDLSDKNRNTDMRTGFLLRALMEQNWMIIGLLSKISGKLDMK